MMEKHRMQLRSKRNYAPPEESAMEDEPIKKAEKSQKKQSEEKWSQDITKNSDALDLEEGVFTWDEPKKIALSLKNSALESKRRKAGPFQSAMSMLNFYINRAGKKLPEERKIILNQAKDELRVLFDRPKKSDEK